MLGEFEYLLIASAVRLGDEAYGAAIRQDVEQTARRSCSIGALYTTLERLEAKGLIETWLGEPTAQRGGRAKRMVRVTSAGAKAASAFYETVVMATRGIAWKSIKTGGGK